MSELSNQLEKLSYQAQELSNQANNLASTLMESPNSHGDFLVFGFTVLILACFVGSWCSVSSAGTGKGHSSSNYRQTSSKKSTTSISRTQGSSKSSGATSRRSQGSSGFFLSVVSVSFILIFPRSPVI